MSILPPPPSAPPSATKKPVWKRWWAIAIAVVIVLAVISAATKKDKDKGATASDTTLAMTTVAESTSAPGSTTDSTGSASTAAATTEATTKATSTTAAPTTTEPPGFGSGTKLVGSDIQPGRYMAQASGSCYWQRLKGLGGGFDDIIANGNESGQVIVDIAATDEAFDSNRCGRWTPYVKSGSVAEFGEGYWVVGDSIAPGRWKSTGGDSCYWARLKDFSGGLNGIVANDNVQGSAIVDIGATDAGFNSHGCGTWTRVA